MCCMTVLLCESNRSIYLLIEPSFFDIKLPCQNHSTLKVNEKDITDTKKNLEKRCLRLSSMTLFVALFCVGIVAFLHGLQGL